jgi:hypothetical protein
LWLRNVEEVGWINSIREPVPVLLKHAVAAQSWMVLAHTDAELAGCQQAFRTMRLISVAHQCLVNDIYSIQNACFTVEN